MTSFTCTNITKNNNNQVISYELQDSTGKSIQISPKKLKMMLESNKIAVVNLMIKNNEIVEDLRYQVKVMLAKFKMFNNGDLKTWKSDCGHEYYVIESPDITIVYIPDDVEYLIESDDNRSKLDFCNIKCNTLKVIGGSGLKSTFMMFWDCQAQSLDLSSFDTSKVTDMHRMFEFCEAQSLDFNSFVTSEVTDMQRMFSGCEAQSLDLSSFDTSNVKNMGNMFNSCKAQSINLSLFNTSKVTDMCGMFFWCEAQSLDLSSFDTSKVTNMISMFWSCKAQSIDLSSFDTSNVENMDDMFYDCKAQINTTDRRILEELQKR